MDILGNTTSTTTLLPGNSLNSSIEISGDHDFIRTMLTSGLAYSFTMDGIGGSPLASLDIDLRNSSGNFLASAAGGASPVVLNYIASSSGTFFVDLDANNSSQTGSYRLAINGDDTIVGNTTSSETLVSGVSKTSRLDVGGDTDYFKVTLEAGITYSFTVEGSGSDPLTLMDIDLRSASDSFITGTSAGAGPRVLNYTPSSTGTFFIDIDDNGSGDTGQYTVTMNGEDTIKSTTSSTNVLSPGVPITSRLDVASDRDYFEVTLEAGITYSFTVDGSGSDPLTLMDVDLRSGSDSFVTGTSSGAGPRTLIYTPTNSGNFFVVVDDDGDGNTGEYTLTLNGEDTIKSTTASTAELLPAAPETSRIDTSGDRDYFKVTMQAGLTYSFTVEGTGADPLAVMDINIRSSSASFLAGTSAGAGPRVIDYTPSASGNYFIEIDDNGTGATGEYTLTMNADDGIEATTASGTSIAPGQRLTSTIDTGTDRDYISVTLDASLTYTVLLEGSGASPLTGLDLTIRSSSGSFLTSTSAGSGPKTLVYSPSSSGTFFIEVDDDGSGATGGYTLGIFESIYGTSAGEILLGTNRSEAIYGLAGDDTLAGRAGNDVLDGGSGSDIIIGDAGNDSLFGQSGDDFLIGGVSTDLSNSSGAQVYRIYQATLDRAPDTSGFEFWTGALESGSRSLQQVVTGFTNSGEFQNTYGSLDNTDFVTLLYNNVLDRAPDQGGLNAWLGALNNGTTRAQVVTGFSESGEFQNNTSVEASAYTEAMDGRAESAVHDDVFRLYQATLDRAPDATGLAFWSEQLADGREYTSVAAGFTNSGEFRNTYGDLNDSDFIDQLYRNVLDREADAGGRQGWLNVINNGGTREDVVRGFAQSGEFVGNTAAAFEAYMKAGGGDTLDGGTGNDTLYSRTTADTFVFDASEDGSDVVLQLDTWDALQFEGFGYNSSADARAQMTVAGPDVRFADQGVNITFAGADLATMQEVDYLFA